ncbi:MAG: CCA tRNA nucleotidyltransferase, partial [Chloroflexota bacterium]|nr:CCA tRNA nucleotidyltransferase [Chloroflexota bacterium]
MGEARQDTIGSTAVGEAGTGWGTGPEFLPHLPGRPMAIVAALAAAFARRGEELSLVGGIVRDALLGRPLPADLDLTTSASTEVTRQAGHEAGATSAYLVGERFGTVGFIFDGGSDAPVRVEVTTYRQEHYPDASRRPAVTLGGTLDDDLARRDFTINAIAADAATGRLVDPFGGQADLHLGVVRAVGDPDARFAEDPLRLLRAARFVAILGLRLDPATAAAMGRGAPGLGRISQERILAELDRLLTGEYVEHGLETLRETGLLAAALPELVPLAETTGPADGYGHREKDLWEHTKTVVGRSPPRRAVRWAALLHDAAKPKTRTVDATGEVHFFGHERVGAKLAAKLLRRLHADRVTEHAVTKLVELHARPEAYEPDWTDSAVRRLALEAGDVLDDLLDLAAADVTSARERQQRRAAERIEALRDHIARLDAEQALAQLQSPLDGDALMALFDRPP